MSLSETEDCSLFSPVLARSPLYRARITLFFLWRCCSDFPSFNNMLMKNLSNQGRLEELGFIIKQKWISSIIFFQRNRHQSIPVREKNLLKSLVTTLVQESNGVYWSFLVTIILLFLPYNPACKGFDQNRQRGISSYSPAYVPSPHHMYHSSTQHPRHCTRPHNSSDLLVSPTRPNPGFPIPGRTLVLHSNSPLSPYRD